MLFFCAIMTSRNAVNGNFQTQGEYGSSGAARLCQTVLVGSQLLQRTAFCRNEKSDPDFKPNRF